jgi:hypothetical protein
MDAVIRERIMKIQTRLLRKTALAAAVTLMVGGVASVSNFMGIETGVSSLVSTAYAAQGDSAGGGQGAMGAGRGGQGGQGAGGQGQRGGGQGQRGGKSVADVLADEADDDSDRPDWAGVPGGEGRPGGGGNTDSGTTKGDDYGDMMVVVRDPVTGAPLDVNGLPTADLDQMLVCIDSNCTYLDKDSWVEKVDGEVPSGVTPIEIDLGRSSLVRAPSSVVDHALDEALSKLTVDGAVISTDPAGRITITVGDVTSTIDSPLENLALYIDLMQGLTSSTETTDTEAALGALANLDTAASLLAGVHDKTGEITLDYVMYMDYFGAVQPNFTGFTYDREYDTYEPWYSPDGVVPPVSVTLDIDAYLEAINGDLPADGDYAALFAQAADDAVEVIELIHTQIVTDDFLGDYAQVINQ